LLPNHGSPSEHRPELALAAIDVLSDWSDLETEIGALFVGLLGANTVQSAAIFATIRSQQGQRDAMAAVASKALPIEQERDVIFAVLRVYENSSGLRNRIAHWRWGYVDELPEAITLTDPAAVAEYHARSAEKYREFSRLQSGGYMVSTDATRVWVYEKRDFEEARAKIQRATELTQKTSHCLRYEIKPTGCPSLLRLSSEPEIRAELARLNKRRKIGP
jgi:hypothetical protein